MSVPDFIFSLNLILLALDHVVTGGLALFFPVTAMKFYKLVFGAEVPFTAGHLFILKPWGALGLFAAAVGILPIIDPVRYEKILWALILLLVLRICIRLMNAKNAETFLHMKKCRNSLHIGLILLCAIIIFVQILTLS